MHGMNNVKLYCYKIYWKWCYHYYILHVYLPQMAISVIPCDGVSRLRHSGAGSCSDMQRVNACGERAWCWQPIILRVPVETGWTEQWGQVGPAMVLPQERQLSLLLQEWYSMFKHSKFATNPFPCCDSFIIPCHIYIFIHKLSKFCEHAWAQIAIIWPHNSEDMFVHVYVCTCVCFLNLYMFGTFSITWVET